MTRHQKRMTVPRSWPIQKKTHTWAPKTSPGPHNAEDSMPLVVVLRDMLKVADNAREAKRALYESKVLINGRARKDHRFPVGVFDIVSMPDTGEQYRMLKDSRGKFYLSHLEPGKVRKLARVDNKTIIKGGKQQLNLNDGTNMLVEGEFNVGDSLVLSIPEMNIEDRIEFKEGNLAMVTGGQHTGQIGKIKAIHVVRSSRPNRIVIAGRDGDFETIVDYVYMVGTDAPVIKLGDIR